MNYNILDQYSLNVQSPEKSRKIKKLLQIGDDQGHAVNKCNETLIGYQK